MNLIDFNDINKDILKHKKTKAGLKAEQVRESMDPELIVASLMSLVQKAESVPIDQIPRLKFQADVLNGLLKKCMPDLRSLEIKENNGKYSSLIIESRRSNNQDVTSGHG